MIKVGLPGLKKEIAGFIERLSVRYRRLIKSKNSEEEEELTRPEKTLRKAMGKPVE